ncbi:head maturation protease, ClpP-related [Stieleria magnilauensis]|uniref:ATP-dependent Clp protease proteolytic subunit n=1 Tax=Stieleria magnilauensis TaxID=2527963 RepID=A0ABX5XZW4_9BACT|nr:ATP-dependent Clp protease proteolytic subunit [Planctomycetes bacterium TBK1r]QDV87005.1 ATP-dependent Clp protease proteolytic subunit [Planctomycetes bacterium TBK1r]
MKVKPFNRAAPKAIVDANDGSDFKVFVNKGEGDEPAELLIFDQIGEDWFGEGVSAKSVSSFLAGQKGKPVNVRINSFGGDVYDGFVIHNALASHDGEVTITVEGIAFSAASYIALAGDKLQMYKASDLGVHRASTLAWGNEAEMESVGDWLRTIDSHLVDIYKDKTGREESEIRGWLVGKSDGTVFSATEAVEIGLADELIDPKADSKAKDAKVKNARRQMSARNKMALQRLRNVH